MDHAWSKDEFDKEDEVIWHKQTQSEVNGSDNAHPAYGNSAPVYGGNGNAVYTYNNQGMAGYVGGLWAAQCKQIIYLRNL